MRARVSYHTTHVYDPPARHVTQILRLTPRNNEGQRVAAWRIDVDVDCALRASEDAFGNLTHVFNAPGPLTRVTVSVDGEIETFDTAGVARGSVERFPPELYLRSTPLTQPNDGLRELASAAEAAERNRLGRLHALMEFVSERLAVADVERDAASAAEVLTRGAGDGRDFAHVFIASARLLDIPARYVSGLIMAGEDGGRDAPHAWAEAYLEELGWIGFDPAECICPREQHLSLARGLDSLGAAPVRGAWAGGGGAALDVKLRATRSEGYARS